MCGCLSHAPYCGPGLQPRHMYWLGSNRRTFGLQAGTQSTEPHQPGWDKNPLIRLVGTTVTQTVTQYVWLQDSPNSKNKIKLHSDISYYLLDSIKCPHYVSNLHSQHYVKHWGYADIQGTLISQILHQILNIIFQTHSHYSYTTALG